MDEKELISTVIEETTKNSVGKIIDGLGSFFGKICMPVADELGQYLKDKVHLYRIINLNKIINKTQGIIENKNIINNISPKSLIEFIDKSSLVEDDVLQNMWAGLLASELTNRTQKDANLLYYNLLNTITPYQSRLIDLIYGDTRICTSSQNISSDVYDNELFLSERIVFSFREVLQIAPELLNYIVQDHDHNQILNNADDRKLAIKYFYPDIGSLRRLDIIKSFDYPDDEQIRFDPTYNGLDLYMNCTGYKLYPLEAYIVTRKYWEEVKSKKI